MNNKNVLKQEKKAVKTKTKTAAKKKIKLQQPLPEECSANNKEAYVKSLYHIRERAVCEGNMTCALRAHSMIGQTLGFFASKKPQRLSLMECSDEDIDSFIKELQNQAQSA